MPGATAGGWLIAAWSSASAHSTQVCLTAERPPWRAWRGATPM